MYTAPFNFVLNNQRTGQINLNSINEFQIWRGLMLGHLNDQEATNPNGTTNQNELSWEAFLASRRGYALDETTADVTGTGTVNYDSTKFDSEYPTQFAGVFTESSVSSAFPSLRTTSATDAMQRRVPDANLFRTRGTADLRSYTSGLSGEAPRQLIRSPDEFPETQRWPIWQTGAINPTGGNFHRDRPRNPAMHFQTLMRLPNLVSDNSQVFLIRMTIGLFEVDANNTISLGAEYGESTGEVKRFKAMFIVDRSIPVGFAPGQDLNARDTVIFERYYQ
ncbi:hypothetical protein RSSM_03599 [Rhodopirellula sallentina SM41]|uniref:Uncharacterized protein n=1 Tax=Rhodopirellula sallentina SM41 TaxID=1263870 RepID=M5U117_9BACT|nr:hypothetical protein RSSM_03599 [Rhodopirellula sallentina SM41]